MVIRLGDEVPNFTAETAEGTINFHEWIEGSWAVLFSHPKDFTPVCTTELGKVTKIKEEFDKIVLLFHLYQMKKSHRSFPRGTTELNRI